MLSLFNFAFILSYSIFDFCVFCSVCCFQSASPDISNPQPPPRRRRPSKKLLVINETKNSVAARNPDTGPHTAPTDDSRFSFESQDSFTKLHLPNSGSSQLETPTPGLNIIPPTPVVDRKTQEDSVENKAPLTNTLNASPKKMIATRTTSLPLVTLPDEILDETVIASKSKSQSQENFTTTHTELDVQDSEKNLNKKSVPSDEHETKHHHSHSQKYSMKSFKKRLKKGGKKGEKSAERNHKTVDPNENHISVDTECTHDDYLSHGSRSENEDYPLTDDDLLSPADDSAFHGDKKEGFFRRMSVKVKQLVSRHDEDQEGESEPKKVKKQDRVVVITDLTDDAEGSKPVVSKKTLREAVYQSHGRFCLGNGA